MRRLSLARPASGRTGQGFVARGTLLARLAASCCAWWLGPSRRNRRKREIPPVLPCACRLPLRPLPLETAHGIVRLSALFAATDTQPVREGLQWRIFEEVPGTDGNHKLVAQSTDATPNLSLPNGNFVVHAALGLAGATKRIAINGTLLNETLVLNAGGLRIAGQLGDTPINPTKLSISIYVPERGNPEAKLVVANAKSGDTVGLPEGNYHIVSTLLDAASQWFGEPDEFGDQRRSPGSGREADRCDAASPRRHHHSETREQPRRRSPRQYGFHHPDAGRRRHPRDDRRVSLGHARRRRICRDREARQPNLSNDVQGRSPASTRMSKYPPRKRPPPEAP